jgi:hypothetical protein
MTTTESIRIKWGTNWSEKFAKCALGLALLALAFALVCGGLAGLQVRQTAKDLPDVVHTEMEGTRLFLGDQVQGVYDKMSADIRFLATTTDTRLSKLESDTFTELTSLHTDTLTVLNTQLSEFNRNTGALTAAYVDIPKVVAARYNRDFGPFTDCVHNKLCLQGQGSDTLFAIRSTSRDLSGMVYTVNPAITSMAASFQSSATTFNAGFPGIVTNFGGFVSNLNRLTSPKWYDRVIGYTLNGAVIFRELNPATNLTIKGAQFISSQK